MMPGPGDGGGDVAAGKAQGFVHEIFRNRHDRPGGVALEVKAVHHAGRHHEQQRRPKVLPVILEQDAPAAPLEKHQLVQPLVNMRPGIPVVKGQLLFDALEVQEPVVECALFEAIDESSSGTPVSCNALGACTAAAVTFSAHLPSLSNSWLRSMKSTSFSFEIPFYTAERRTIMKPSTSRGFPIQKTLLETTNETALNSA